jgi:hypothetical protein
MKVIVVIVAAVALTVAVNDAFGQDVDKTERAFVKQVLASTVKALARKLSGDEKAIDALRSIGAAGDDRLDRMARDLKKTFAIMRLNADEVKSLEKKIADAIKDADVEAIHKLLVDGDPRAVRILCWLVGCD